MSVVDLQELEEVKGLLLKGQQVGVLTFAEIATAVAEIDLDEADVEELHGYLEKSEIELVEELDPAKFWQIHRSTIVNVDAIAGVTRDFRGRQLVQVKGRQDKLEVSRNYTHLFKQM